jgi:hypothetical protein
MALYFCNASPPCQPSHSGATTKLNEQLEALSIRFRRWMAANAIPMLGGNQENRSRF